MIQCTPRGICSWDFILDGDGHRASVEFDWIGESGQLVIDGHHHTISKQGMFSGKWTFDSPVSHLFTAQKNNPFTRTFEISGPSGSAILSASSAFGRTMTIAGDGIDCTISPAHPFTRRASIEGHYDDFRLIAFAFWLATLTWRRAARNNAGGGS
jgi:hypothetical protein